MRTFGPGAARIGSKTRGISTGRWRRRAISTLCGPCSTCIWPRCRWPRRARSSTSIMPALFPGNHALLGAHLNNGGLGYGWDRANRPVWQTENQYIRHYWQGGLELVALAAQLSRQRQSCIRSSLRKPSEQEPNHEDIHHRSRSARPVLYVELSRVGGRHFSSASRAVRRPSFQAQRWSLATEPKVYAVTNQIFGCSGYYCLAPGRICLRSQSPRATSRAMAPFCANRISWPRIRASRREPG